MPAPVPGQERREHLPGLPAKGRGSGAGPGLLDLAPYQRHQNGPRLRDWDRPAPKPGDTITVHKGPGKASEAVISEFLGLTNTPHGRTRIECAVKPDWE